MKRAFLFLGAIVGVLLSLTPLFNTVFGMMRAYAVLGSAGISDPSALSRAISQVLLGTVIGFVVWPAGATLAAYCITHLLKVSKPPPPLPFPARQ